MKSEQQSWSFPGARIASRGLGAATTRGIVLAVVVGFLAGCATLPDPKAEVAALGALSKPDLHVLADPFFARETLNRAEISVVQGNNTVAQKADEVPGGVFIGSLLFLDLNSNISLDFSQWFLDSGDYSFSKLTVAGGKTYIKKAPGTWQVEGSWTGETITIKDGISAVPGLMGVSSTTVKGNRVSTPTSSITLGDSTVEKVNPSGLVMGLFLGPTARPTSYDWVEGPLSIEGNTFFVTPTKIVVHAQRQGSEVSIGVLEVSDSKAVWTPRGGSVEVFEKTGKSITKNGQPFITWE